MADYSPLSNQPDARIHPMTPADLPELPDDAQMIQAAPAARTTGTAADGPVQLRELDKAPLHLRRAAMIAVVGCLLPWMGHGGGLMTNVVAKVLVLLGMGCLWIYWKYRGGEPVMGLFAKLSELSLIPKKKDDGKKKRRRGKDGPDADDILRGAKFPAAIHVLALLLVVASVVVLQFDTAEVKLGKAAAELGMLAWGAAAWVHIYAFERGGKFNPLFPLMFLGHAAAGVLAVLSAFQGEDVDLFAAIGGGIVAAGGFLAAYTIIEALRSAKSEGDAKKQAALEARKTARKARTSG